MIDGLMAAIWLIIMQYAWRVIMLLAWDMLEARYEHRGAVKKTLAALYWYLIGIVVTGGLLYVSVWAIKDVGTTR